jgi:Lon-like protease
VNAELSVYSFVEGSAAEGTLEEGDVILSANGETVTDAEGLRAIVQEGQGDAVELSVIRDGDPQVVSITPTSSEVDGETVWLLGITLMNDFEFPIDVTIQLNNVGGPSAGMMFALGIIDTLTPGELNGGENVAGTGTITADGEVGPIGGIRQKLYGAKDAGADWFLAPETNCDEVIGHVPDGLRVFSVGTLDDAMKALEAISGDGDLDELATCEAN